MKKEKMEELKKCILGGETLISEGIKEVGRYEIQK